MQKENNLTAGQWCDHWFTANRHKWNSNTEGGYRNLIYSHIIPSIGGVVLSGLTKQTTRQAPQQPAHVYASGHAETLLAADGAPDAQ